MRAQDLRNLGLPGSNTELGAKNPGSGSGFLLDLSLILDKPFHLSSYFLSHEVRRLS